MASGLECGPHRCNPTIHHIGWAQNVGPGLRLCQRHLHQRIDRFIIYDNPVAHDPVMAKRVIGIKRDIRHYSDIGRGCLDGTNGAVGKVVWVPGFFAELCFQGGVCVGKDADGRDAHRLGLARGRADQIYRTAQDARHRRDGFFYPFSVPHENGPDQIIYGKRCLAGQAAQSIRTAQPAQARGGEGGLGWAHGLTLDRLRVTSK